MQELVLICKACGGNVFHFVTKDDMRELECIGCERRYSIERISL